MKRLDALMTVRMVRDETGLPDATVRSILRRCPKVPGPTRTVLVRRRDVEAALQGRLERAS